MKEFKEQIIEELNQKNEQLQKAVTYWQGIAQKNRAKVLKLQHQNISLQRQIDRALIGV